MGIHLLKLGGSLIDLPDMPARFEALRASCGDDQLVLVVGGGDAADIVRAWDRIHHVTEEQGHWLAVRAMQLNAHLLGTRLKGWRFVADATECRAAWAERRLAIVDPLAWLEREAAAGIASPKEWSFTSDSIAAHIAVRLGAVQLTLLKSTLPGGNDLGEVVDSQFEKTAAGIPHVQLVNLRSQPPGRCVIR